MTGDKSKKKEFQELMENLSKPSKEKFLPGRCEECQEEVWIDSSLREVGMAQKCEEHEPLCHFVN